PVLLGDAPGMTFLLPCPHAIASAVRLAVDHRRTVISGGKSVHEQRVAGAAMFSGKDVAAHAGLAPVADAVLSDEVEVNVILGLRQHGAWQRCLELALVLGVQRPGKGLGALASDRRVGQPNGPAVLVARAAISDGRHVTLGWDVRVMQDRAVIGNGRRAAAFVANPSRNRYGRDGQRSDGGAE